MDERYYLTQGASQQRSSRSQYNIPQPRITQQSRPVAPRERYRATQHDHPMYDVVEDDYEQSAVLDDFDERILEQLRDDRQHQAQQGRARLSLAPKSSRSLVTSMVGKERGQVQAQHMYQEASYDRDQQVFCEPSVRGSLSKFAYNAGQCLESSSDIGLGVPSSPAMDAGRRRAGQCNYSGSQQPSQFQPVEEVPPPSVIYDRMPDSVRSHQDKEPYSEAPRQRTGRPFQPVKPTRPKPNSIGSSNATPTVQGIPLVPVSALPDRLRTIFPFPMFNAVQSKCFDEIFRSDDNFVLSAPTGSGKTAILELAICRAVASNTTGQYKIVYQAPTKALCSERQRDWDKKFTQVGLKCVELTGDSDASDLRNVQSANIIVTTPEKWDSMTRKWKDHARLMRLIKLFLIDEVHILKENRGAVLEVVVSRMKSIGTDVRFVALSATVPNFHDVASWLGKSSAEQYLPAPNHKFGEEFRPVKLRKHVCGYMSNSNNDFAFEQQLNTKLPEVIAKYSEGKPIMVFCATRKSCASTAALIANWWGSRSDRDRDRLWSAPKRRLQTQDKDLRDVVASGVAFHHAGLSPEDRVVVESGFLCGDVNVICCTSTLAVGVNLPCHLVIIKNTMVWTQEGIQEYSDLEMMQMLGRAGRPQFDDSAVAVIMTRQAKAKRYETLVTGEEVLESKLHLNLIDHMNAEIGLGTIKDLNSARTWLTGTFLYVRLQQNPVYYKLEGSRSGQDIQEQVDDICFRDITLLREYDLASGEEYFKSTEYGHAMARYYVHFETMKIFMGLPPKASLSEILSAVAQAAEYSSIRFRQGEKSLYKALNTSAFIRYPIPVNLDLPAQKVSLIIQSVLGCADIPWDGDAAKHKTEYLREVAIIFKSISSLIRCIIDCQIYSGDSVSIHNALMLERSLGSKAWDDSPNQMIQIPNIGTVAVRKLVSAAIRGIEDLEATDARRIEALVGRNPPFGLKVLEELKSFPKLRVTLHIQPSSVTKTQDGVKVQVKADIGFVNEKPPQKFGHKLIYVCLLAETSDGRMVHFARINGHRLGAGQSIVFPALLTSPDQKINCYLMCESIAGSMRGATADPKIASSLFPPRPPKPTQPSTALHQPNVSKRRIENVPVQRRKSTTSDDFVDADIDDDALVNAAVGDLEFDHIDNFATLNNVITRKNTAQNKSMKEKGHARVQKIVTDDDNNSVPVQLSNGRWACSHKCKDKDACKHYCCKHGMDRPPKRAAPKPKPVDEHQEESPSKSSTQKQTKTQTKLHLTTSKRKVSTAVEELDLTQQEKKRKTEYAMSGPRDYRDLYKLHKNIQKKDMPASLHSVMHKKPAYCYGEGGEHELSFLSQPTDARPQNSSEYGDLQLDELAHEATGAYTQPTEFDDLTSLHFFDRTPVASRGSETFRDEYSLFGEAFVGLADSQELQTAKDFYQNNHAQEAVEEVATEFSDVDFPVDIDFTTNDHASSHHPEQVKPKQILRYNQAHRAPIFNSTSSPEQQTKPVNPAKPVPLRELPQVHNGAATHNFGMALEKELEEEEVNDDDNDITNDLLNVLDVPPLTQAAEIENVPDATAYEDTHGSAEVKKQEDKRIPDAFKDLQPWLFEEFGDIVELVDE